MSLKKYEGSCECGKVRYVAEIDLEKGTSRCNCTFCGKTRNWGVIIQPKDFRLLTSPDDLSDTWSAGEHPGFHNYFCKSCGVRTHGSGHVPQIGGDFVSVLVHTIDGLTQEQFAGIPVRFMDGLHDRWMEIPKVTGHL